MKNKLRHLLLDTNTRVPEIFFLPGDPSRISIFQQKCSNFEILSENREFVVATGIYKGCSFGVCSTGIGGGSAEIAVCELATLGVKQLIRVGGCGAIQEYINCGDLVIVSGAVRKGGSSSFYVTKSFPAVADPSIVVALRQICESLSVPCHIGIVATVNSYYEGQGRQFLPSRENVEGTNFLKTMQHSHVLGMDMETETILVIAYLLGIKGASLLIAHGNRMTNQWLTDYRSAQQTLVRVALEYVSMNS